MSEHSPLSEERGLIAWFAQNHVAANILMLFMVIGGILSIASMRTETFPSVDPQLVTVSVAYPGATPYEVADSITERVEEVLAGIEGVKRITSTASEGYGITNVELEDFSDGDDVYNEVETAVNGLVDFPPEDAERPRVTKVKSTPQVLSLALHGKVPEETLKYWAETIEDELCQLPGVALTALRGIRDYEISIEVSEESLRQHGLSLNGISNAISAFSTNIPAGTVESTQGDVLLRVQEKKNTGAEFAEVILRTLPDGSTLTLGDIAKIDDGFEDSNLASKFNGERAAFIDVSRSESEDTLRVAKEVKDYLKGVNLPSGLSLTLQQDETAVLVDRISLMLRNAVLGFALVFLILLLFLDLKLAFWTSVAIPVSFLGGLMIINWFGFSINMISLFALIVVLGIVVDDAIVTGESIFEEQERHPDDPKAVLRGVKSVIAPVTVGVTTTMAAFAPLIFSTGVLGQIIGIIPVVVIAILFISLVEVYFILPAHLSKPGGWSHGIVADIRDKFTSTLHRFVDKVFLPIAKHCLSWRYLVLAAFIGITILTISLVSSGLVRFVFFPQIEGDEVSISVTMPEGTPFEITERALLQIENEIETVRGELKGTFQSISLSMGSQSVEEGPGAGASDNQANRYGQVTIQLVPSDYRSHSSSEIERMIRERIIDIPNVEKLEFQSSPIGGDAAISLELTHADDAILNQAAENLQNQLKSIKGTKEVQDSYEHGKTEYIFTLTKEGLAVGLTPENLGRSLRGAFFGLEAQRFQREASEVIVYVRYPKDKRESLSTLSDTRIRLDDGREVPLSSIATISQQTGYSQISTVNGRRVISVTSDVELSITTPNEVMSKLNSEILPALTAQYPGLHYSYEGQSRDQMDDLASLGRNMLLALLLIYMLLGAQLKSYVQPLVIMCAIPCGIVGAIWGHILLGHDLSFVSMFGVVALTGVVINDSVVLIDYLDKKRRDGLSVFDSALAAIKRRFRPILLTTLTTSLGLLPMLLETSMQARFLIPMVVSLATGLLFATLIILVLVPSLVLIVEDIKSLGLRFLNGNVEKKGVRVE